MDCLAASAPLKSSRATAARISASSAATLRATRTGRGKAMRWLEGFEAEEKKQKDAMHKTFFSNKSEHTPCVERSIVHFGVAFDVLQCCFN